MNRPFVRRLKPRQRKAQSHLRGLSPPIPHRGCGESPQGDLVPFVAANSFAGFLCVPDDARVRI